MRNKIVQVAVSALFWLGIWFLLAWRIDKALILPSPVDTIENLAALALGAEFWTLVGMSILRIMAGLIFGVLVGILLAVVTYRFTAVRVLFAPLLSAVKATPVASFIIIALVWMARDSIPIFISFLMVLPIVWQNVFGGLSQTDRDLLEVASVYRFGAPKTLRLVYLPSLLPYFSSAVKTSIGLAWKAGIAAEVLCTPPESIGKALHESKLYLETTDLFSYTLAVILISILFETACSKLFSFFSQRKEAVT